MKTKQCINQELDYELEMYFSKEYLDRYKELYAYFDHSGVLQYRVNKYFIEED
ncbi:hypothetical protein V1503_18950 [Bacillus sp. SCS-151]|uniref:hypothetical protein n=1 Tax=Nanhaiella sioensis TaxID=3115293 RepID=UPI00397E7BF3